MGRRVRRGGRSPSSSPAVLDRQVLLRRINASNLADSFDVDGVVHHLRSQYPDYARIKAQPFTQRVHKTLEFLHTKANPRSSSLESAASDDDGVAGDGHDPNPVPARSCHRPDRSEQRLLRAEAEHLRLLKRRRNQNPNASSSDDSSEGSTSTSESEDAIFEAKVDPEFDLMKSMLRNNYGKQAKAVKPAGEEDMMEIEAVDEKKRITIGSAKKGRSRGDAPEKGRSGDAVVGRSGPRFEDLGGMNGVLEQLKLEVMAPLLNPQVPELLGIRPMTGILLHGPPGCGKTKLAHAIANEAGVPFYKISAPEIVSGVSGASEENIRDLFKKAYRTAPSIVFIDEIDVIASKRDNLQREMERRIVTQLMTCMEESPQNLGSADGDTKSEILEKKHGHVLVIGATNRPDAVDQALRRPGRFDREIALGVPDENARFGILSVLARRLKLEGEFNLMKIARSTPGFVGADLAALVNKAGNLAMKRIMDRRRSEFSSGIEGENIEGWWRLPWTTEEMESLYITMIDFEEAIKMVQPSSQREGFSSIPATKWEDVGGLNSLRKEFDRYIVQRIKNPEDYDEIGVNMEVGFLLYGPPGCGKTLIAKAVANEAGANFIHIKGPELLNKYVGESELAVRTIFSRARTCSPCILFFDEVDALTTMRGREGGWVVERLLNQLLIELDGADQRQGVYVIGATNRLEVMDPAVLRPGRFGRLLYVPLPSAQERGLILKALARAKPVAGNVDLDAFGRRETCQNLTGADLAAVVNEAAMVALEERQISLQMGSADLKPVIKTSHFEKALEKIKPSVNEKQRIYYETLSTSYRAA